MSALRILLLIVAPSMVVSPIVRAEEIEFSEEIEFERDVAPILEERCWYCHGEDEQESGLRLDVLAMMLRGGDSGVAAVVPGKPQESYLIEVIKHLDPDVQMPPDDDKMPDDEIELLVRWVQEGAKWPGQEEWIEEDGSKHWSFQPVQRPSVPETEHGDHPSGNQNANIVDAFLRSKLQQKGLDYSQAADPRSLIRRASIVLTGLPPTQEQTDTFLLEYEKDSKQAYSDFVDQLLDSPSFGERWAQHWLDVIRWAETNGSEANLYRKNAWVYRDYLIRAFQEDLPYDQFLREQMAGDSLGVGEATGFLVSGPHVPAATVGREPSAIRQARADRMDEIMQTIGASVMGVTMGCARCHNHKFDPISIEDYYSLTAVFQDVEFGSRHPEYSQEHPIRKRGAELWRDIAAQRDKLRELGGWEENWGAYREMHFPKTTTKAVRFRFKMPNLGIDELEVMGPKDGNQNLAHQRRGVKLSGFPETGAEGRNPIDRVNDGEYGTMIWRTKLEKGSKELPWVRFDFEQAETINRIRVSNNREYFYDTDYLDKKPHLPRYEFDMDVMDDNGEWKPWTGTWAVNKKMAQSHPERKAMLKEIQRLIDLLAEEGPRPSFVGRFIEPSITRVLLRGSPESPRGEVMPSGPKVFGGELDLDSTASGPKRRATFARWVTDTENPLTSRVMVNRIWHHIFGKGIVTTTSDFGAAGAPPTHPELLDWLASEFVEPTVSGGKPWSVKSLIRLLVTSDAFQQSSHPRQDALRVDSADTLLWRFPPRRVEAEVIRDSILQASGLLDRKVGGRGYRIHNEKKTYAQWEVVDNHGPETWRRMIYQERMRRVDDQMFTAFDFPDCGQVRAIRPVSTTPLQALNLMNSDFVMEQSRRVVERATGDSSAVDDEAVQHCFEYLLGRRPNSQEQKASLALAQEAGLEQVCRAIINSNEFAFLP